MWTARVGFWKGYECDTYNCVFSASSPYRSEKEDIFSEQQESSFMLFAKWKKLCRLKLEGLKCVRAGKFFIQVNVICMMKPWYIVGIGG
jgi:hypothetical protein